MIFGDLTTPTLGDITIRSRFLFCHQLKIIKSKDYDNFRTLRRSISAPEAQRKKSKQMLGLFSW
jgi:hypothetical protein